MASIKITGIPETNAFVKSLIGKFGDAVEEVVKDEAEAVKSEAEDIVPVKTGRLRDSFNLDKDGKGYIVGNSAPYAPYVHEMIENDGSKFLEKPAMKANRKLPKETYKAIKKVVDKSNAGTRGLSGSRSV